MAEEKNLNLCFIILAAGMGKRMLNPSVAKVMSLLDGKPLIDHVLKTVKKIEGNKTIVVVGHQKQGVIDYVKSNFDATIEFAEQNEQLGTGHAVMQTENLLKDFKGEVLILAGDVPLLSFDTIGNFIEMHHEKNSEISVLTTHAKNPFGYGRIIRDTNGDFIRIVEEKDANDEERKVNEINSGVFLVNKELLFNSLKEVSNQNAQGEYYLTDIIGILRKRYAKVFAFAGAEFEELQGVNSPDDLRKVEEFYYFRKR